MRYILGNRFGSKVYTNDESRSWQAQSHQLLVVTDAQQQLYCCCAGIIRSTQRASCTPAVRAPPCGVAPVIKATFPIIVLQRNMKRRVNPAAKQKPAAPVCCNTCVCWMLYYVLVTFFVPCRLRVQCTRTVPGIPVLYTSTAVYQYSIAIQYISTAVYQYSSIPVRYTNGYGG